MGVELYELKPTPVQLQRESGQVGGDVLQFFNSFIQGGGSIIQHTASLVQIGGSSLQFGGSSRGALHAKTFVLDRQTVFVGSFNFDPARCDLDTQNGVVIRSPELAEQAAWLFTEDASPTRTYRVTLLGDDDLVWVTEEKGTRGALLPGAPELGSGRASPSAAFTWLIPESML